MMCQVPFGKDQSQYIDYRLQFAIKPNFCLCALQVPTLPYSSSSVAQLPQLDSSAPWEAPLPLALPQRFKLTSKILMSTGETPEIRAAWPTVAGRIVDNFCRA